MTVGVIEGENDEQVSRKQREKKNIALKRSDWVSEWVKDEEVHKEA